MVLALVGDSTMINDFAMKTPFPYRNCHIRIKYPGFMQLDRLKSPDGGANVPRISYFVKRESQDRKSIPVSSCEIRFTVRQAHGPEQSRRTSHARGYSRMYCWPGN
jgi:hypothetical protein